MKSRDLAPKLPMPPFRRGQRAPEPAVVDAPAQVQSLLDAGTYVSIDVGLIDENPLAPREAYPPAMIAQRAEELRAQGQHDPIHIMPNPDRPGRYLIADGWTRVQACRDHGVAASLFAVVHYDLSVQAAAWFGYEQNECRQQHTDLDRAFFYAKLIAAGESAAEVARRAKVSKSLMTFYSAFTRLPEALLDIIRMHPERFGSLVAYHLAKLCDQLGQDAAEKLALQFVKGEHPQAWLISHVTAMLNPTTRGAAPVRHVRYTTGYFKELGDTVSMSIRIAEPDKRAEFSRLLEQWLNTLAEVK